MYFIFFFKCVDIGDIHRKYQMWTESSKDKAHLENEQTFRGILYILTRNGFHITRKYTSKFKVKKSSIRHTFLVCINI
jgi:hypothetical protein